MAAMPRLMGILNVTPDSFSGDGLLSGGDVLARALEQARDMIGAGADILDIGGESTRPGATPVSADEECARILPVIRAIREKFPQQQISVDTFKVDVARAAIEAGATIINDISGEAMEAGMFALAAQHGVPLVVMHNRARASAIVQSATGGEYAGANYQDVVTEVSGVLQALAARAEAAGLPKEKIILDPGIGFGKSVEENMRLINHADRIKALGYQVLIAPSRKSFIGRVLGTQADNRLEGTAGAVAVATMRGADILRVHDVAFISRLVRMISALVAE